MYVTGQLEKGKEETPHIQYYLHYEKTKKKSITALRKHCKHSHYELIKINNGANEYCNKEEGRLDGPFSFGVRPARRNQKGDTARRNAEIMELGAVTAMERGIIPLKDVIKT